jgi:hypothetical protein
MDGRYRPATLPNVRLCTRESDTVQLKPRLWPRSRPIHRAFAFPLIWAVARCFNDWKIPNTNRVRCAMAHKQRKPSMKRADLHRAANLPLPDRLPPLMLQFGSCLVVNCS